MKRLLKSSVITIIMVLLFSIGCSNPSIINVDKKEVTNATWNKIYIPRFEGNPNFVEESTDYFISILESESNVNILQGSSIRIESSDIYNGGNIALLSLALKDAKLNNADILVLGKVTSHNTGSTLNGFSTIRVYNVATGEKIANFHEPSGLLFANSEHQCVMDAVKNTANQFIKLLK